MILLWFILGMLLILGIARYNESNKLFWVLFVSYIMGFAGAKMVIDLNHKNEQSNVNLAQQVHPTQTLSATLYYSMLENMSMTDSVSVKVTALKSVSQEAPAKEVNITPSRVFGGIRDQPIKKVTNPPEQCGGFFDTS